MWLLVLSVTPRSSITDWRSLCMSIVDLHWLDVPRAGASEIQTCVDGASPLESSSVPAELLHPYLRCGQSTTSLFRQSSSPGCAAKQSQQSACTVFGHSLLLARLPGTHWVMICVIPHLALTVSDVYSRLVCFQSTSTSRALEVLHSIRYINLRLTYCESG